ncbi:MAG: NfeD family protein [Anaerolineae bacterium]
MVIRHRLRPLGAFLLLGLGLLVARPAHAGGLAQEPLSALDRLLAFPANPNVAYLLLVMGLLGLVAEIVTAGSVFPGVVGTICLLLSFYGLLQLPTNWIGIALIAAGIVMFLADIKVTGFGLSIGALISFALGSLLIFTPFWVETPSAAAPVAQLNPWVILAATGGVAAFFLLAVSAAVKAQFRPVAMGQDTMIGKIGVVKSLLDPEGIVHLEGEEWTAVSATGAPLSVGTPVRVVGVQGLRLQVVAAESSVQP